MKYLRWLILRNVFNFGSNLPKKVLNYYSEHLGGWCSGYFLAPFLGDLSQSDILDPLPTKLVNFGTVDF